MAIALLVTFEAIDAQTGAVNSVSSQTIPFIDNGPALRALEQIEKAYEGTWIQVKGVIIKDMII